MKNWFLAVLMLLIFVFPAASKPADDKIPTTKEAAALQQKYLEAHLFEKAKILAEKYPGSGLKYVPGTVIESPAILENPGKYYELPSGSDTAFLKSMDLSSGTFILIYSSPASPLSETALNKIVADGELAPAFFAWASLLTDEYDFRKTSEWNEGHRVKYKIMYSKEDWVGINRAFVPGFNFFRDGKLVCYAGGWTEDVSVAELKKCAGVAGLDTREARMRTALRIIALNIADKSGYKERLTMFEQEYRKLSDEGSFGEKELGAYGRQALLDAYELTDKSMFYFPAEGKLLVQENILAELEKRTLADAGAVKGLYEQLLDARKFDKAGSLRSRYPDLKLEETPKLTGMRPGTGERLFYLPEAEGKELKMENAVLKGKQIIIAAQPDCSPTRRAFIEIGKNKRLQGIFKNRAMLLAARSNFAGVSEWNVSHAVKFRLIDLSGDWPGMDFSNSPTFYFLEDGKVLYSFVSWPKEGNMAELNKGLSKLGL